MPYEAFRFDSACCALNFDYTIYLFEVQLKLLKFYESTENLSLRFQIVWSVQQMLHCGWQVEMNTIFTL